MTAKALSETGQDTEGPIGLPTSSSLPHAPRQQQHARRARGQQQQRGRLGHLAGVTNTAGGARAESGPGDGRADGHRATGGATLRLTTNRRSDGTGSFAVMQLDNITVTGTGNAIQYVTNAGDQSYRFGNISGTGLTSVLASGFALNGELQVGATAIANATGLAGGLQVGAGATLSGAGSVLGTVNLAAAGHVAPGASAGTLTVQGLLAQSGSFFDFQLGPLAGPNDLLIVSATNGLTLNGGTVNIANLGGLQAGTYTLIDYNGALGGGFGNLTVGSKPPGTTCTLINDAVNTLIKLQVEGGTGPVNATWATNADGRWSAPGNWSPSTVPGGPGATANFTGNALGTVNVDGAQTVGRLIFNQNDGSTAYSIGGATHAALSMDNTGGTGAHASISATAGSHTITSQVVTTSASDLDISVSTGASLSLSGGINNNAAKALTLSSSGTLLSVGDILNAGAMTVSGTAAVGAVSKGTGSGTTIVNAGSSLTATAIVQDTLSIGAGATVTIRPATAEDFAGGAGNLSQVPEPATWALLCAGLVTWLAFRRRSRK